MAFGNYHSVAMTYCSAEDNIYRTCIVKYDVEKKTRSKMLSFYTHDLNGALEIKFSSAGAKTQ